MTGEAGVVEAPASLVFQVPGIAVPQGSKRAFAVGNRAMVVDDNKAPLKLWRSTVIDYAQRAIDETHWEIALGPVSVMLSFFLPKPKSRPKKDHYPDKKPDIDKLARAALDALDVAGVFQDDAQVCFLTLSKAFVPPEAKGPHTYVIVKRMEDGIA